MYWLIFATFENLVIYLSNTFLDTKLCFVSFFVHSEMLESTLTGCRFKILDN